MSSNIKEESNVQSSYASKTNGRKFGEAGFEFFATFLFMFSIFFARGDVRIFAFGFWVILTVFGGISGAHVNPAITLGFYITDCEYTDYFYSRLNEGLNALFITAGLKFNYNNFSADFARSESG